MLGVHPGVELLLFVPLCLLLVSRPLLSLLLRPAAAAATAIMRGGCKTALSPGEAQPCSLLGSLVGLRQRQDCTLPGGGTALFSLRLPHCILPW